MKEKSQLEEMRAAVRGDLERARARREADPWRTPEPERQPDPEPELAKEPTASQGLTPEGSVPAEAAAEPVDEVVEPAPAVEVKASGLEVEPERKRSGFLARLFGRGDAAG